VMDFRDEIVATGTVLGTGVFDHQNAAETTHKGLELSATVRPLSAWTLSGNAMLSSNTFDAFGSTNYDGNDIPNFPDKMVNLRVSCQQAGFWGSLWLRHVGGYYYDIPNTAGHEVDAYTTVNARLSYRFDRVLGAQVIEPGISINNLLNAKYDSWGALFYGMPTWTPAATRNVMLSIKVIL